MAHHQAIADALDPDDVSRGAELARRALLVLQEILALEREHLRVARVLHRSERPIIEALLDALATRDALDAAGVEFTDGDVPGGWSLRKGGIA